MMRDMLFAPEEWYHCLSRGVDKRTIFMEPRDYERFQMLLYICNSTTPIRISDLGKISGGPTLERVLTEERGEPFVDIGAYELMPNHYHLLLREITKGGITSFMRKLGTGFTMFFNLKYERTGALFSGRFKTKHIKDDNHFRRTVHYIHSNIAEIYEPRWKEGVIGNKEELRRKMLAYPYSSLPDYEGIERIESAIINKNPVLDLLEDRPDFNALIKDARAFYGDDAQDISQFEF
ncbi:MAG: transposase [Candidatus Paceibacterota bacterium]